MDDADTPPTQPSGSLGPPTKIPTTALALVTPPPPPAPRLLLRTPSRTNTAQFFANLILDSVDEVADAVAGTLGLRR
jgi:hypothetical protein